MIALAITSASVSGFRELLRWASPSGWSDQEQEPVEPSEERGGTTPGRAKRLLAGRFADRVRDMAPEFEGELLELRGDEAYMHNLD